MEIISPWALYWILQLDSIKWTLSSVALGSLFVSAAAFFIGGINQSFSTSYPELDSSKKEAATAKACFKMARRISFVAVPVLTITSFLPSTKNMAAIVVVPAIVNNATVQNEASEIYQLAKQAMRNAVDVKPETENTPESEDKPD